MLAISIVLKPAVLGVSPWKKAAQNFSPHVNDPKIAGLSNSRMKIKRKPAKHSTVEDTMTIFEFKDNVCHFLLL